MTQPSYNLDKISKSAGGFMAGQIAAYGSSNYANATDAMVEGMDVFWKVFQATGNNPCKHGNLFECIEAAKFNTDAAIKNSNLNAQVTAQPTSSNILKNPHSEPDILITKSNKVVREVQAKCYKNNAQAAVELKDPKYSGMQRVVPIDKEPKVRVLVEKRAETNSINAEDFKDVEKNLTGETHHENITSGGTTYNEAVFAKNNPRLYSAMMQTKQVAKEAGVAGAQAAAVGLVIGGGISAVKNLCAFRKGDKTIKEGVMDTAKDGAKGSAKAGGIGASGALVRFGARKAGLEALTKSNVAMSIAAGVIDTGVTIYSFTKGEITPEETMERMGQTGVSITYGLFAGAVAGAVFSGPVSVLVATMTGYLVANFAYQSCISIFKEASLTEEQAGLVVALCEKSILEMQKQKGDFESKLEESLQIRREEFGACFASIDSGLSNDNPSLTVLSLSNLAGLLGNKLNFETFKEFDDFMTISGEPLRI